MKIFDDVLSTAPLRALLSEIAQCETDIASAEQRHQEIGDAIRDQDLLAAKVASNKKPVHEPPKKSVLSRILKGDLVTDDPEKVAQREQHNFYVEHEHSQIRATIETMKNEQAAASAKIDELEATIKATWERFHVALGDFAMQRCETAIEALISETLLPFAAVLHVTERTLPGQRSIWRMVLDSVEIKRWVRTHYVRVWPLMSDRLLDGTNFAPQERVDNMIEALREQTARENSKQPDAAGKKASVAAK